MGSWKSIKTRLNINGSAQRESLNTVGHVFSIPKRRFFRFSVQDGETDQQQGKREFFSEKKLSSRLVREHKNLFTPKWKFTKKLQRPAVACFSLRSRDLQDLTDRRCSYILYAFFIGKIFIRLVRMTYMVLRYYAYAKLDEEAANIIFVAPTFCVAATRKMASEGKVTELLMKSIKTIIFTQNNNESNLHENVANQSS